MDREATGTQEGEGGKDRAAWLGWSGWWVVLVMMRDIVGITNMSRTELQWYKGLPHRQRQWHNTLCC